MFIYVNIFRYTDLE